MDPNGAMVVEQQVAVEVVEFELVVRMQCRGPMFGNPELFDKPQVGIFILGLKEFRICGTHGIDFEWRSSPEMKRHSGSVFVLNNEVVLEGRSLETSIRLFMEV